MVQRGRPECGEESGSVDLSGIYCACVRLQQGAGSHGPGEGPGLEWPQVQVTNAPGAGQRGGSSGERKSPGRKEDARRVHEPRLFSPCGSAALEWLTEQPQAD